MKAAATKAGANVLHGLRWVVEDIAPAELRRRAAQNPTAPPADVELDLYTTLNELPLGSNPLIRDAAPFYLERLAHPTPGEYWLDKGEPGIAGLGPISSQRSLRNHESGLMSPLAPFRHRAFFRLWLGVVIATVGTWAQMVGAQWLFVHNPNAATIVTLVQTVGTLPMMLLALPAGVLADAFDRRWLMFGVQIYFIVVAALLAGPTAAGLMPPACYPHSPLPSVRARPCSPPPGRP